MFLFTLLIKVSVFLSHKDDENERIFLNSEDIIRSLQQSARLPGLSMNDWYCLSSGYARACHTVELSATLSSRMIPHI